jgi:hypothetical protein
MLKKTLYFMVLALGLAACDTPYKLNGPAVASPEFRADSTEATGDVEQATPHRKLDQAAAKIDR